MNQNLIIGIVIAVIILIGGLAYYYYGTSASTNVVVPPSDAPTVVTNKTTGAVVTVPPSTTATAVSVPDDTSKLAVAVPITPATTTTDALKTATTAANSSDLPATVVPPPAITTGTALDVSGSKAIVQSRPPFFTFPDTDWGGYDLSNAKTVDTNACGTLCGKTANCGLFTYGKDGVCYMKQFQNSKGVFSVKRPDGTYLSVSQVDLPGFDLKNINTASIADCNAACTNTAGCSATAYFSDGSCYMKKPTASVSSTSGWMDNYQ